jgi:hypothetical protein
LDTAGRKYLRMDTHIKLGKSILDNYSNYADTEFIDDEAEYFPTLKVIIEGIAKTIDSPEEKEEIESVFIDHVKQHYVSLWIKHAGQKMKKTLISITKKAEPAVRI